MCFIPLSGAQVQAELVFPPMGLTTFLCDSTFIIPFFPWPVRGGTVLWRQENLPCLGQGRFRKAERWGFRLPLQSGGPFPRCPQGALPGKEVRGSGNLVQDGLDSVFYGVGLLAPDRRYSGASWRQREWWPWDWPCPGRRCRGQTRGRAHTCQKLPWARRPREHADGAGNLAGLIRGCPRRCCW